MREYTEEQKNLLFPKELEDSVNAIAKMTDEITRTVDEAVFRRKYLPILTDTSGEAKVSQWLDVAGNSYEPVSVIKDGKVLFVVPPLQTRHPTISGIDHKFSTPAIMEEAGHQSARVPRMGIEFMVKAMSAKIQKRGVDMEHLKAWDEILTYYGLPTIMERVEAEAPVVQESKVEDVFDGEYLL